MLRKNFTYRSLFFNFILLLIFDKHPETIKGPAEQAPTRNLLPRVLNQ